PEKNITLDIGKKVKRMIVSKLGLSVVMTRETDEEVSLNSRVSKANNRKAQLFVSIHANSSFRRSARGPETFFVSLKATDKESFRLSQKENSSFEEIGKLTQDDDLKMILWSMAQSEYIKESSKLADFIQYELNTLMSTRNRGVKQAPFRVLMRAAMPAVLVEIGFISNRREEQKLKDDAFKSKVAGAIYNGISKYIYYHNNLYRQ
ncbi:MAG: N-acetylmuramoyl-L-alanine amidase, partial [bacterium]|nr:N-acetylmuramoyl-L-alanine amidase [bacterium]